MNTWTFAGALVIFAVGFLVVSGFLRAWLRYRGKMVVTCPETAQPAAVDVDALHAAEWKAVMGREELRLSACSRWPERAGCGQDCLGQIEHSPESCLVKTIVTNWYDDRTCAYCKQAIGPIVWHERPPGALTNEGTTVLWKEVAAESLPKMFETSRPVCWKCHIVESFRREHPQMVIERHPIERRMRVMPPSPSVY